jgi:hypothetical protein
LPWLEAPKLPERDPLPIFDASVGDLNVIEGIMQPLLLSVESVDVFCPIN